MQVVREKKHQKLLPDFWNESLVEFEVPLPEMVGEGIWCRGQRDAVESREVDAVDTAHFLPP